MTTKNVHHPNLYEVNTRLLLTRYKKGRRRPTLRDIPDTYWQELAGRGMDWVWLMGVWTLTEKQINPNLIPGQMMTEFTEILPDLTEDDIDGSTYAIDDYTVDPVIGGESELFEIRTKLSELGMRLMLDFIPNHYGAHTHFIHSHPEYFIEIEHPSILANSQKDTSLSTGVQPGYNTFYTPLTLNSSYFAHGKDPYFDAWQDTIQINYGSENSRNWMTSQLLRVASLCDGVRCDMAMLPVKRVFEKTWRNIVTWDGGEFWPDAIKETKDVFPTFKFLAEVYWDMEAELLHAGFDYCYDKTFYDRLTQPSALNSHYHAEQWYLAHTARFLENHDEKRIASRLDLRQHMAAAAMVAFGPGMRLWHMGQWEGRTKHIPVQITREPFESCGCLLRGKVYNNCDCTSTFYRNLFGIANQDIFKYGIWERIDTNEDSHAGLFLWKWVYENKQLIVAINYSSLEIDLNSDHIAFINLSDQNLVFPQINDAYCGMLLRSWDVRIWEIMQ